MSYNINNVSNRLLWFNSSGQVQTVRSCCRTTNCIVGLLIPQNPNFPTGATSLNLIVLLWRNSKILLYRRPLQIPNQDPSILSRVDTWPTSLTAATTRHTLLLSVDAKDARTWEPREQGGNWDPAVAKPFPSHHDCDVTVMVIVLARPCRGDPVAARTGRPGLCRSVFCCSAESESGGRRWSDNGCH